MLVKAFRLFISSTFADFAQERELLQTRVFPSLDRYCAAKGYQFLPLDLRWGINAEAQLNQRTSDICLDEVRAAKGYPPPNFLIMMGNRYGWVPLPYAIAKNEFEILLGWLAREGRSRDLLALSAIYELDENILAGGDQGGIAGAYTLRSREDEIPELRPADAWFDHESRARTILQEAIDATVRLGQIKSDAREKYFVSLTEQEILLGVPGLTTAARSRPDSPRESGGSEALVFIRELASQPAADLFPSGHYRDQSEHVELLKSRLRRLLPDDDVLVEQAVIGHDGRFDAAYLERFVAATERALIKSIDRHIALVTTVEARPDAALQSERAAHQAFAEERCRNFVGREDILERIASFIAENGEHPLFIFGPSGLGKSALMARAAAKAHANPGPIIARFVGASAASSDVRSLLISLVEDLTAQGIVAAPPDYEAEIHKFCDQIKALFSSIAKPVTIFLDALDQLNKPHRLGWLPSSLPGAARLVISVLNDPDYEADSGIYCTLRDRFSPDAFLEIQPLSADNGHEMLLALERDAGRSLQEEQRQYLLERFETAGASPLYMKVGFVVTQSWKSTGRAGSGRHILAGDTSALISQFIHELTAVHHHERTLVTRVLGYIAAARDGLSVKELTDILAGDPSVMQAISSEQFAVRTNVLPPTVWVRLYRQLGPFLVQRRIDDQPLLQFFHRQLVDVVRAQHYEPRSAELHHSLASYFDSRVVTRNGTSGYNRRSLSELPYQLHMAGTLPRLGQILMSPAWLQQKLEMFGPHRLVEDYQFAFNDAQKLVGRTLQLIADILLRDARQLAPQLIGRLMGTGLDGLHDFLQDAEAEILLPAIVPMQPSLLAPGAEIARFESLDFLGTALACLPNNRLAAGSFMSIRILDADSGEEFATLGSHEGPVRTLALLNQHTLASAAGGGSINYKADTAIRIWDLNSLEIRWQLEGHTASVGALVRLDDGRLASGSDDGTIRIWDVASGSCITSINAHTAEINCLALLADGRLASGSKDGTIRVWNIADQAETHCLVGHIDAVTALAALPDGRLASGSRDGGVIRLWELDHCMDHVHLSTGSDAVTVLAALPDGRLASGSQDGTVCFWNLAEQIETARLRPDTKAVGQIVPLPEGRLAFRSEDSRAIHVLDCSIAIEKRMEQAHDKDVVALCALSDGRIASGSSDSTIKIWNPDSCTAVARLSGHRGEVRALAGLPNNVLASGSSDHSICLWDLSGASNNRRLVGHDAGINTLTMLPDGRLASGSEDRTVRLWDIQSGAELARLEGQSASILAIAVHPDGTLVSGAREKTVRFWNLVECAETRTLELFIVRGMAILPDGRLVLAHAPAICVYNSQDGTQLVRFALHKTGLIGEIAQGRSIVLLANGWLATAASDNCVRIWNPDDGRELACLELDSRITSLVALPGGRLVAGDIRGQLHWLRMVVEASETAALAWPPQATGDPAGASVLNEIALDSDFEILESYLVLQKLRDSADRLEEEARHLEQDNQWGDAFESLKQARASREQALRDYPDWILCRTELAETHRAIGRMFERDKQLRPACAAYEQAERLYAGLSITMLGNRDVWKKWNSILLGMGSALHDFAEFGKGLICFERILRLANQWLASEPDNFEAQENLAYSHCNVGYLRKRAGKRQRAYESFVEADCILTSLLVCEPVNNEWRLQLNKLRESIEELRLHPNIPDTDPAADDEPGGNSGREALANLGDSLEMKRRIATVDPDNSDRLFALAEAHEAYGDMLIERDEKLEAISSYADALLIRQGLANTAPGRHGGRLELIALHDKIGDILVRLGRPEEALVSFRATAAMEKTLADANPDSDVWRNNLSISHNKIGGILLEQKQFAEALEVLSSALAIREALAAITPDDAGRQNSLLASLEKVGSAFLALGDRSGARQCFQRGIGIANRLMGADSENIVWVNRLATFWFSTGEMDAQENDYANARKSFEFAVILRSGVAETEPDDTDWQEQLEAACERAGTMQILTNDLAGGLKSFQASHAIMKRLVELVPGRVGWQYRLAKSYFKLTIGYMETKSRLEALAAAGSGRAILQDLLARFPDDAVFWERELARFDPLVEALGG